MYTIIKAVNGTIHCEGKLQDGTERWTEPTLEAAIKSMKVFAKVMNGTKLKKKGITYLQEQSVIRSEYVKWSPV